MKKDKIVAQVGLTHSWEKRRSKMQRNRGNIRMGRTRDFFKKIRDTKGTFHAKMCTIKDRNRTETEDIKEWKLLSCVWLFATPWTVSMEFSRPENGWVAFPGVGSLSLAPEDLPNPRIEPRSLALQADSLPAEPQGKPKNTGISSLSHLQRIILTQELNQGLLHCRKILYQLSYKGRPY